MPHVSERRESEPSMVTRDELLVRHAAARARRNGAELGSEEWIKASTEVEQIEVEIARIERAMDPPLL